MMYRFVVLIILSFLCTCGRAQHFFVGADLSYVNEMEDCGVAYRVDGTAKDPYQIFADRGANLVRLRLWHTPAWQDTLNEGRRYSNLADVKRGIRRAKAAGMAVLLDFHLSDFWADPERQLVPAAWAAVVDDLPVLQDSLYDYVAATLEELARENLLPEMVQVGNETNKGILQSAAANAAGWALDWPRNAALFNTAIRAIRDVEASTGHTFRVALHVAGPSNAAWLLEGFTENGVTDFDVIGLSYYWAWHQPLTIPQTGAIIAELRRDYPGKEVMIFETGYLWTRESNDQANNIINAVQEGYAPASPEQQRRWLTDLTREVYARGGSGVLYWEPAWVSSPCFTPWGQGSHQEHAAFFDFENELLTEGGIGFLGVDYAGTVNTVRREAGDWRLWVPLGSRTLFVTGEQAARARVQVWNLQGELIFRGRTRGGRLDLRQVSSGVYLVELVGVGLRPVFLGNTE
ncbi:MAG: glycosyl hydrolase 53 family protein [Bacteroidota bacterium]